MCIKTASNSDKGKSDLYSDKCHIKIALLGNVSAGKTTFLNALLMDKYGEVSMKRCTASVCYFSFRNQIDDKISSVSKLKTDKKIVDAIRRDISDSNKLLRKKAKIEEKHFSIERKPHFISMNEEVSPEIIIVDIPGLNESTTSDMYKDYVRNKFHTFSIIIVVMDATQGVNTNEQVDLLKFVDKCVKDIRKIPIMVVMNKVDPDLKDDEELCSMVEETEDEVRNIFGKNHEDVQCIPMSAEYSYIYRSASKLSPEEFALSFSKDSKCINKIGKEEFGRKWNKMSINEKSEAVYNIVKNKEEYSERLKDCNFDRVLSVLDSYIGAKKQHSVIYKHIQFELQNLTVGDKDSNSVTLTEDNFLFRMLECLKVTKTLGMFSTECVSEYKRRFWILWDEMLEIALHKFKINPASRESLVICGDTLQKYATDMLLQLFGMNRCEMKSNELDKVKKKFKSLIYSKNEIIWVNAVYHKYGLGYKEEASQDVYSTHDDKVKMYWRKLSPGDWHFLLISSTLMSYEASFACELASCIAQMRSHELQFSKMAKDHFHSTAAVDNCTEVKFGQVRTCSSCARLRDRGTNSQCSSCLITGSNVTVPTFIPKSAVSTLCTKCGKSLNANGFCGECKLCPCCGFLDPKIDCDQCYNSGTCGLCMLCPICACGNENRNGSIYNWRRINGIGSTHDWKWNFENCSTLAASYKEVGTSISIECLKKTSWFTERIYEPVDKKLESTYPTSAMLASPKNRNDWGHLEYIFTKFMNGNDMIHSTSSS